MTKDTNILNELLEISPLLAQISRQMPYSLPGGYFDTLDRVILARVAAGGNEENSLLSIAGKTSLGTVPEGYFDSLAGSILEKIKNTGTQNPSEELQAISPVVAGIGKQNVYEVPAGYFDQLSSSVIANATEKETAKVVSIFSKKVWLRYAAAAVVFGAVAFGINFLFTHPAQVDDFVKTGLNNYQTEKQLNDALAQINDDDIYNYLQATTIDRDTETITEIADESQLPAEEEYSNDSMLESFMNQIELPGNTTNN